MKIVKLVLLLVAISVMSCSKEEVATCTVSSLKEAIVGKWSVKALGQDIGQVEFKADGTLVDPDDVLISGSVNGISLTEKTYSLDGNTKLKVKAAQGSNYLSSDLDINNFNCNELQASMIGIPATFTRK